MSLATELRSALGRISTPAKEIRDMLVILGAYNKQYSAANEKYENTWYVDGRVSASGDGSSWDEAFKTFAEAIAANNATIDWADAWDWHRWNRILVAPGLYNENLETPFSCHVFGMGTLNEAGVRVEPDEGSPMSGAALGLVLDNIEFGCRTEHPVLDFSSFNNSIVRNCILDAVIDDTVTHGIGITEEATKSQILNNQFINRGLPDKGMNYGIYPAGMFVGMIVKGNIMDNIRTAGIYIDPAGKSGATFIEDNTIIVAGTGTGIDDNVGDSWIIRNHIIVKGAGDCINNANTSHVIKNDVSVNGGAPELET